MKKMKKKLKKIGIGIAVILVVVVIFLILKALYDRQIEKDLKNKNWIERNVSLIVSDINEDTLMVDKYKKITTYNMLYQEVINEDINDLLETDYSIDSPLMIYNPYSTNNNSINFYFKTDDEVKVSYTIKCDGYADFSRTLKNNGEDNYTTEHEYQIIGFVMGGKNELTLTLTDKDGESEDYTFDFDFSDYENAKESQLETTDELDEELTDGLFAILGDSSDEQDYLHLYDNDGVLRSEMPIVGYRALRLLFKDTDMYLSISETKIAKINSLGMVEEKYDLGKYKLHHDYAFDNSKGNLLILASDTEKDSCEDAIIKLNLESGEITDSFYLEDVFPDLRESAYYNEDEVPEQVESVGVDWMHINTINYLGNNTVILSSRETSSIIKIKNIFDNPEIEYIIGDEEFWDDYDEKEYLLEKIGDFTIQGGQHTVTYEPTDEVGVYYLTMFNNNLGISMTVPDFDWSSIGLKYSTPKDDGKSYYYKYKVDENEGTFELVNSFEVPYSAYMSSSQDIGDNIIVDSGQACEYSERNGDGKIIRSYKVNCWSTLYRVFKYDFDNLFVE